MNVPAFPNSKAIETLQLELSLLRILHHRNKNQHHLQPFFKHLSILKRTLSLLLDHADSDYLIQKLRRIVIPSAWESFSRVVARGEFITLGLVLCACTARISFCLGGLEESDELSSQMDIEYEHTAEDKDEIGEIVLRELLEQGTEEFGNTEEYGENVTPSQLTSSSPAEMIDELQTLGSTQPLQETVILGLEGQGIGEIQPPAKKRRKKKKQDDIDILFAGLA